MGELFHHIASTETYVDVILPVAVPKPYTYYVPEDFINDVVVGCRVEVSFGRNKLYSGLVANIHNNTPSGHTPKPILNIIDKKPTINQKQLKLWGWMANYYGCTLGEVMNAALPANLKLTSETRVYLSPTFDENFDGLSDDEYLVTEALSIQNELSIDDIRKILNKKTIYSVIRSLIDLQIIFLKEELQEKYKPKQVSCVDWAEPYKSEPQKLNKAFDLCQKSEKQTRALMVAMQLLKDNDFIQRSDIYKKADVDGGVLKAMEKKGIFRLFKQTISRLGGYSEDLNEAFDLSAQQVRALAEIETSFETKNTVLLHGVTGSGKTRVYIELMQKAIAEGKQVLYLLPEIALTSQIITRLQKIFGDEIAVYHSRLSNQERVEIWRAVKEGKSVMLGARSCLFLPFEKLDLIIVDEEHDTSYKQHDPAPRYNARDTAVYLGHLHKSKVLLGTATPSIETYYNAKQDKYGLVEMPERFGGLQLPKMVIIDAKEDAKVRQKHTHFTTKLIEALKAALERGEQAILFQNRRGYAPSMRCVTCGWAQECTQCDVTLTYHKFKDQLQCHYCGYSTQLPKTCPACGSLELNLHGFGTEKIEDELKIYFPDAKVARMDWDTVKSKNALATIINDFEEKRIDILVGTQMVTKGLDFENVGIVGVLSADQILQFPDFRSGERGFQLITQVAGRAGRKHKQGTVIVQAMNVAHPVLAEVLSNDFPKFYEREISERHAFNYPPFMRLIKLTLKHKKPSTLNDAARLFGYELQKRLDYRIKGPAVPYVSRVRGQYVLDFLIKMEKDAKWLSKAKRDILEVTHLMQSERGYSNVRVNVDVDPL